MDVSLLVVWGLSEVVRGVPTAVCVSNRTVPRIGRCKDGALALRSRPPIEGRNSDIVFRTGPV
jgi:hypothetical protein